MKAWGKLTWDVAKTFALPALIVGICGIAVIGIVRLLVHASECDTAEELACARLCGVHRVIVCRWAHDPSWPSSRRVAVCASESGVRAEVQ